MVNDTGILSSDPNPRIASFNNLQLHLNKIEEWSKKCQIKINESKPTYISFTLKMLVYRAEYFNIQNILSEESVKYWGIHMDSDLAWETQIS